MNNIFNSIFEISIRVLIVLNTTHTKMSLDRISCFDFLAVYGKDFGISDYNLHGNNNYRFSEYTAKRILVNQAIKDLVLKGYVTPFCYKKGFYYNISNAGEKYCNSLCDEYAEQYQINIQKANSLFLNYNDRKLLNYINEYAINKFGGEEI